MKKKKILVVDDEKDCCDILHNYLTRYGYEVDACYDGEQAEGLLKGRKYEYIFFDCNMPHISGIELIKVIKEKNPEAKKIMISGYPLIDDDFVKNMGVDLFLRKPIILDDIKKILEKL
jgi:DNA-binding NtrC family response regulator